MTKLLLATNNKGKIRELKALLRGLPYELVTPEQVALYNEVEETGTTYEENARLKAVTLCRESGLTTLADDSGLEVDALDGEPGSLSARYAGENASDKERVDYLLSRLKNVPREKRTARFVSVVAIATPGAGVYFTRGECEGIIAFEPKGNRGFGYDPIFYLPELDKTMAELPMSVKNRVSHRGKAAREARQILQKLSVDQR